MDQAAGRTRLATIASVDPNTYSARVKLQPEDVLTGWLPMKADWVGAGWGMVTLPEVGDQVVVVPQEGDSEHGIIIGRVYSDQQRPPKANPKELWLVHHTGSFIKLIEDGTIQMKGDLHVDGEIFDKHGSVDRLRQNYSTHAHTGVQSGASTTAVTNKPDPE